MIGPVRLANPRRVCLLVDHPFRDLQGLILLAHQLVRRGAVVFLVSMHEFQEVYLLKPDLVVLNYVKAPYAPLLEILSRLGIGIAVLDTEGVVLDANAYAENVSRYLDKVDLYCVWGLKQFEAMVGHQADHRVDLRMTGCPRYDFAVQPWRSALKRINGVSGKMILVNTNFPLINPRFQSAQREAADQVKVGRRSEEFVQQRALQSHVALQGILTVTRDLSHAFPEVSFVLRPHPFEDRALYDAAFAGLPNLSVRQDGTVFEWINHAVAVIHHNCQTAVEAAMMGVEPLHLAWLPTPQLAFHIPMSVSRHPGSFQELGETVRRLLAGDALDGSAALKEGRMRVIGDWFYKSDGKSSERVADAVLQVLDRRGASQESGGRLSVMMKLLWGRGSVRKSFQMMLILALGGEAYRILRRRLTADRRSKEKSFGVEEVQHSLRRLDASLGGDSHVQARQVHGRDVYLRVPGSYTSVRVANDL